MNNHFGFCSTDALIHLVFHHGKMEWQFPALLYNSLPRITPSGPQNIRPLLGGLQDEEASNMAFQGMAQKYVVSHHLVYNIQCSVSFSIFQIT